MKKSNEVEEVLKMEDLRKLCVFEFLKILRDEGIVCGNVVMNSQRLVKRCLLFGFKPNDLKFLSF